MTHTTIEHHRKLAASFLAGGLDQPERDSRARILSEAFGDSREAVRVAERILPGFVASVARGDEESIHILRKSLGEIRALTDLDDTPGLLSRGVLTSGTTGLDLAIPLVRQLALDADGLQAGYESIIPALPEDATATTGVVDPSIPLADGALVEIANAGAGLHWRQSVVGATVPRQIQDFVTPTGEAMLDQIIFDAADRGAEVFVGEALVAGAATTTPEGSNLAGALLQAESLVGAALEAPAGFVLSNPADWPRVRSAIPSSWQFGPAPAPFVSMGVPAGTVILTGRTAFELWRKDHIVLEAVRGKNMATDIAVARPFHFSIRRAAGIQAVELEAPEEP